MYYFENFPKTIYNFDASSTSIKIATNILARTAFMQSIMQNVSAYYPYTVKDTDTLQSIADKYYGDANRYWIIMMFNQLFDPYFDFPMNPEEFQNYIINNYGSISYAQTTLKQVEKTVITQQYQNGFLIDQTSNNYAITGNTSVTYDYAFFNTTSNTVVPTIVNSNYPAVNNTITEIPIGIPDTISPTRIVVTTSYTGLSIYDYEFRANENRREIKLLDKVYIYSVETQLKQLLAS